MFILYQQLQFCLCFMAVFTELSAPSPASPGLIPGAETPPSSPQAEIQPAGRNRAMQILCVAVWPAPITYAVSFDYCNYCSGITFLL